MNGTKRLETKDVDNLYRRYAPMVMRRCRGMLRDEDMAADAMQETFVQVLRHRESLDARYPSSLLYRIATNTCLNAMRSRRRKFAVSAEPFISSIPGVRARRTAFSTPWRWTRCSWAFGKAPDRPPGSTIWKRRPLQKRRTRSGCRSPGCASGFGPCEGMVRPGWPAEPFLTRRADTRALIPPGAVSRLARSPSPWSRRPERLLRRAFRGSAPPVPSCPAVRPRRFSAPAPFGNQPHRH